MRPGADGLRRVSRAELFAGGVGRKIHLAQALAGELGPSLLARPEVRRQLALLARSFRLVRQRMGELRLADSCQACAAASPTGGCCSQFMGGESDAILLLLNLLAGRVLDRAAADPGECFFLGRRGCVLRYKPFFCLNYLCLAIVAQRGGAAMTSLNLATGRLLQLQYGAEQLLLAILKEQGRLAA